MRTVFLGLHSRKTVRFSEQKMFADKHLIIFPPQMEAIVYVTHKQLFEEASIVNMLAKWNRIDHAMPSFKWYIRILTSIVSLVKISILKSSTTCLIFNVNFRGFISHFGIGFNLKVLLTPSIKILITEALELRIKTKDGFLIVKIVKFWLLVFTNLKMVNES